MKKKLLVVLFLVTGFAFHAQAKTKEFCGKRDGTAGNSSLIDEKGEEILTLSTQGESDILLQQADDLLIKGKKNAEGMNNGKRYCLTAELDENDEPKKIVKARIQKKNKKPH